MGFTINQAALSGNLCADPELRQTRGGTAVLSMRVAVNERVRRGDEWADEPSYIDVVVFGGVATALSRELRKGSGVAVAGRLRQTSWQAKDGTTRSRVEVVAEDVVSVGRRGRAADEPMTPEQAAAYVGAAAPQPVSAAPRQAAADVYDEDIPF